MSIVGFKAKGGLRDDGEEALADGRFYAAVEPAAPTAHRGSLSSSPRRSSHTRSRPLSDGLYNMIYDEASPRLSGAGFAKGTGTSTKIGRPMGRGGHMPAEVSTPWLIGVSHWERGMQC